MGKLDEGFVSVSVIDSNESKSIEAPSKPLLGFFTMPENTRTERRLSSRQAHLLAMGGCIGTALFLSIGSALAKGGPLPLFLAYALWCTVVYGTNCVLSEMTVYLPIDGTWIRYVDRFIDESIGVANGWNYFLGECTLVCFECTAFGVILTYWTDKCPVWLPILLILASYILLALCSVDFYGEVEFWLASGKVILIVMMIFYTLFTMCGANPARWSYGFTYWKNPGLAADYLQDGGSHLSYFEGFLACLINASFTIAGPDYVSMCAGEVKNPRVVLPRLFRTVTLRLFLFFILGALAVGIVCPYNSEYLLNAISNGDPGAAISPYVISMKILNIKGLPHLVNALLLTTIYSSGNGFFYCAVRSLYGMACEGRAPKVFKLCLKNGAPVSAICLVSAIGCLAFLQLGNSSQTVLNWFIYLSTSSLMIYMMLINAAYIRFRKALKAQNIPHSSLPLTQPFTSWIAWYSMTMNLILLVLQGYTVFKPGNWNVASFLFSYFMVFFVLIVAVGWKLFKRNKWLSPAEIDLTSGKQEIDDYCETYIEEPPKNKLEWLSSKIF